MSVKGEGAFILETLKNESEKCVSPTDNTDTGFPPPVVNGRTTIKRYLEELKAAKTTLTAGNANRVYLHQTKRRIAQPLTLQIEELMRSLPPNLRDRPWSMEELVLRLVGKYRDHPHAADVGKALRKLGWKSNRDWSTSAGGRRYWISEPD